MRRVRLKPGAILELHTSRGLAYLQYVGKHADFGDVIRVLYGFHKTRPPDLAGLAKSPGYYTFYAVRASASAGFVEVVSNAIPLPSEVAVPEELRRPGMIDKEGNVLNWIIERKGIKSIHRTLTESEKVLPILAIWSHDLLVTYVTEEWTPSQEW